jgi:hypothetical protein
MIHPVGDVHPAGRLRRTSRRVDSGAAGWTDDYCK